MGNNGKKTEMDKGKNDMRHKLAGQRELMNLNWNKSGESIERGTILRVKAEIRRGKCEEGKTEKAIKPNICKWQSDAIRMVKPEGPFPILRKTKCDRTNEKIEETT
jgi:hypothetical protein